MVIIPWGLMAQQWEQKTESVVRDWILSPSVQQRVTESKCHHVSIFVFWIAELLYPMYDSLFVIRIKILLFSFSFFFHPKRIWIVLSSVWKQALFSWWTDHHYGVLWPRTKRVERDGGHDGEEDGVRGCHHERMHLCHRRVLLLEGDVSPEHWKVWPRS